MNYASGCPVCGDQMATCHSHSSHDGVVVDCPRCGNFELSGSAETVARHLVIGMKPEKADAISHAVRLQTLRATARRTYFNSDALEALRREAILCQPIEQLENLVLWLGSDKFNDPAAGKQATTGQLASIVGARNDFSSLLYLLQGAKERKLLRFQSDGPTNRHEVQLTFDGWEQYALLSRVREDSRNAFMAMAFSDVDTDRAYRESFKPGVADAGFNLRRLDEGQPAGLIDDQLRVAIRSSRFLIADLTNLNRGAYWEAGFAEGLGKHVIYVCEERVCNTNRRGI